MRTVLSPNDAFAGATGIPEDVGDAVILGNAQSATVESGEPQIQPQGAIHRSVWWRWTPAYQAPTRLSSSARMQLFEGATLESLRLLGDIGLNGFQFEPEAGKTYHLRGVVSGANPARGEIQFNLTRTILTPVPVPPLAFETNADGSLLLRVRGGQPLELDVTNASPVESFAVVELAEMESGIPVVLATSGGTPHRLVLMPPEGRRLLVRIQGRNAAGQLRTSRGFHLETAPSNDAIADATPLDPAPWVAQSVQPILTFAGTESGDPEIPGAPGVRSVWYRWTAPSDGVGVVDIPSQPAVVWLGVYHGAGPGALGLVGSASNQNPETRLNLAFAARAGVTYSVALAGDDPQAPMTFNFLPLRVTAVPTFVAAGDPVRLLVEASPPPPSPAQLVFTRGGEEIGRVDPIPGEASWTPPAAGVESIIPSLSLDGGSQALPPIEVSVAPANDSRRRAVRISGDSQTLLQVAGTLALSTREPGEVSGFPDGSGTVWYRWAPVEGRDVWVRQTSGAAPLRIELFAGNDPEALVPVTRFPSVSAPQALRVTAGTVYWFAVSSTVAVAGPFGFALGVPPGNDDFVSASVLPGLPENGAVELDVPNVLAGVEPAERSNPALALTGAHGSLWWRWTAPETGDVTFHLQRSDCNTVAGVFTGDSLETLVPLLPVAPMGLGGSEFPGVDQSGFLQFRARRGVTYHVAAGGFDNGSGPVLGRMRGHFLYAPNPGLVNDLFADRTPMTGREVLVTGDPAGAGLEPEEPSGQFGLYKSLWWTYTAPADGAIRISYRGLHGAPWPVVLAFTGDSLPSLMRQSTDGDLYLRAGESLHLAAGGDHPFELSIRFVIPRPPSPNDAFADRPTLPLDAVEILGNLHGATVESGEPVVQPATGGSLWWGLTAPADGILEFTLSADTFGAYPQLFAGSTLEALSGPIPFAHSSGAGWRVTAGQSYALKVSSSYGTPSEFRLTTRFHPRPSNDAFASGIRIETPGFAIRSWILDASLEAGEPRPATAVNQTLWWTWAAAADGRLEVGNWSPESLPMAVYSGPDVNHLQRVPLRPFNRDSESGFAAAVREGEVYHVQAGAPAGEVLPVRLDFALKPFGPALADAFAQARILEGDAVRSIESVTGATRELGEPLHLGRPDAGSIWWRWTAPRPGRVQITPEGGTASGAMFAVYQGPSVDALQRVAQGTGFLAWVAEAGETYVVAAEVPAEAVGDIGLVLSLGTPPGSAVRWPGIWCRTSASRNWMPPRGFPAGPLPRVLGA